MPDISVRKNVTQQKGRFRGLFTVSQQLKSALTSLETRVALADHKYLAATADNLAVTMPRLGGLQRVKHLHGELLTLTNRQAHEFNEFAN